MEKKAAADVYEVLTGPTMGPPANVFRTPHLDMAIAEAILTEGLVRAWSKVVYPSSTVERFELVWSARFTHNEGEVV